MSDIKLLHHGATRGVTGSCHQLFINKNQSVLVDCGLFQGAEHDDLAVANRQFEFDVSQVAALIVTHCHIDHVGRIPALISAGFKGPIIATEAAAKLLPLVLEDAIKIGVTKDKTLIEKVLTYIKQITIGVPYRKRYFPFEAGEQGRDNQNAGFCIKFQPAGHILGSAYVECDLNGKRITFSGDLGAPYAPLLPPPKSPYKSDLLVLESTYGDKLHEKRKERAARLKAIVEKALKDKGTVLVPAFSIGRTQELLYELEEIIYRSKSALWKELDIIVDSPLAAKFTTYYRELSHLWDKEARKKRADGRHPLAFENLITIESHHQHTHLVHHLASSGRPAIVIAASGMCAGGRMENYLKALLGDTRTDVLFVGYQAHGTPGRTIQVYGPKGGYVVFGDRSGGDKVYIKAGVHTIGGYSAHADQLGLINFVQGMKRKPAEVRLVHGEQSAKQALKEELDKCIARAKIWIPE
ncbi:MAG: MBL fold metallo-hydrolase RNA specificity domain-containing protein [Pontibacterium sp.]